MSPECAVANTGAAFADGFGHEYHIRGFDERFAGEVMAHVVRSASLAHDHRTKGMGIVVGIVIEYPGKTVRPEREFINP
jgi:hypothetical protein